MTEQEIVRLARSGDHGAFTLLVDTHQTAVFNLCYRLLGDAEQAEDASQETFLRLYTCFRTYDPERPFRTWLLSVASHHCIDRLRRRRLRFVDIDSEPLASHPALREKRIGPEETFLEREHAGAVKALLDRLGSKDRAVIVLRYWCDLSYQEIAEVTGCTVSSVKSRLHRARVALADLLDSGGLTRAGDPSGFGRAAAAIRPNLSAAGSGVPNV